MYRVCFVVTKFVKCLAINFGCIFIIGVSYYTIIFMYPMHIIMHIELLNQVAYLNVEERTPVPN